MNCGRWSWKASRSGKVALLALALVTLLGLDCDPKNSSFFVPVGTSGGLTDVTPPLITGFLPGPNVTLNDDVVMATITDPAGPNGATPSGIDVSGISAANSAVLPVTMAGTDMYNADITGLGDGMHTIDWTATDGAGNTATASQTIEIDRTAPDVAVDPAPPASATSDEESFTWTVGIDIDEPNFLDGSYTVRLAGPDQQCGTGDDVTPTLEQVPTSTFDLDAGSNSVEVVTNNGVPPGGQPNTAIYCGSIFARDDAVTKAGDEASNTFTSMQFRTDLTWMAPQGGGGFNIGFGNPAPGYCHTQQGQSITYAGFGTTPAQANAQYQIVWTGPAIVGGGTRSGSLDASGGGFDQQNISQLGTYDAMLSITSGGTTRTASASVNVGASQGACQQFSSARYKRGIVALLPADARPLGLRPVAFRYREPWGDPAEPRIGLVAEEVAEVFPEAVGRDPQGRPHTIDYRTLSRRVVETAVARTGAALEAAIGRLAPRIE